MSESKEDMVTFRDRMSESVRRNARIALFSYNACLKDNVTILASGLVYSSLVAVVPFAAIMLVFFTTFGIAEQFYAMILDLVSNALGDAIGIQIVDIIRHYSTNAMGLGVFGLISFIVTALLLVNKIYSVINKMFYTQPSNGMIRRFSNFFLILIIGVFLLSILLTLSNTVSQKASVLLGGTELSAWHDFLSVIPQFALMFLLFFTVYRFVPNAKVKSRNAVYGAAFATVSLIITNYLFKSMIVLTVSYSVIYGSLASILFVLLFLYVFWYIVLVCAKMVYVRQFKPDRNQIQGQPESPVRQISQAVNMLMIIAKSYKEGEGPVTDKVLIRKLGVAPSLVYSYIEVLEKNNVILPVNKRGVAYVPAKPLDAIYVKDVVGMLYGKVSREDILTIGDAVSEQLAASGLDAMGNLTVENLLERV
jgi:Predicted membrane protein